MGCVLREIDEKLPEGTDPDYENTTPTAMPYLNGVRTGSGACLIRKSVYWAVVRFTDLSPRVSPTSNHCLQLRPLLQVIYESLRLHPPVPEDEKHADRDSVSLSRKIRKHVTCIHEWWLISLPICLICSNYQTAVLFPRARSLTSLLGAWVVTPTHTLIHSPCVLSAGSHSR